MSFMKRFITLAVSLLICAIAFAQPPYLQSATYDVSKDFEDYSHNYFFADAVSDVNPADA